MLKMLLLLIPVVSFSQTSIPKKANTIEVKNVSFHSIAEKLLDAGYTFDHIDREFQTIKTEYKRCTGKNKWIAIRMVIRVKDSVATIRGDWYNALFLGTKTRGVDQTVENLTEKIEYTRTDAKKSYLEMLAFAESLHADLVQVVK